MRTFTEKLPIEKGWSGDRKYRVTDEAGRTCLLRVSPAARMESRRRGFARMQRVAALGVRVPEPVEWGVCDEGVYTLEGFIDGQDAGDAIPALPPDAQYALGLEAGRMLRKIHSLEPEALPEPWEARYGRKVQAKLRAYAACPVHYPDGQAFLGCIGENLPLLAGRPQTVQHGDYHRGNMMLGRDGQLYVIDFDRHDDGDPWEDMKAITWDAQLSPAFASGRIDGYFGGEIPEAFWRLLALYISVGMISSLPWAMPYGEEQLAVFQAQAEEVLRWYDGMRSVVPAWYGQRE